MKAKNQIPEGTDRLPSQYRHALSDEAPTLGPRSPSVRLRLSEGRFQLAHASDVLRSPSTNPACPPCTDPRVVDASHVHSRSDKPSRIYAQEYPSHITQQLARTRVGRQLVEMESGRIGFAGWGRTRSGSIGVEARAGC